MQMAFSCLSSASERRKRSIEVCRPPRSTGPVRRRTPLDDGHVLVGRNDVNAVGLDRHAVRRLDDRHLRVPGEQFDHQAFVLGIEMRNEHEGDAAVGRHGGEEFLECVQSAGRRADADDRHAEFGVILGGPLVIGTRVGGGGLGFGRRRSRLARFWFRRVSPLFFLRGHGAAPPKHRLNSATSDNRKKLCSYCTHLAPQRMSGNALLSRSSAPPCAFRIRLTRGEKQARLVENFRRLECLVPTLSPCAEFAAQKK